jgi:nucleotide-binding universal stress UspA family protein
VYEHIVVGTDGSDTAGVAVNRAIDLAQAAGAELDVAFALDVRKAFDLARVVEASNQSIDVNAFNASMRHESEQICAEAVAGADARGVKAFAHVVPGDAPGVLLDLAEEVGADLIIVGNHGMLGVRRFVGSVPNTISHHAPCDVLIVNTSR